MPEVAAIEFALQALHIEFVREESHFDFETSPEMLITTGGPVPQVAATTVAWAAVTDKPAVFTPASHTHIEADIPEIEPQIDPILLFENALV